jgi:hypothetical protein
VKGKGGKLAVATPETKKIATLVDQGLWRPTQKQRDMVVFIMILELGHAQPVTFGQKSQRPCTYLLSSISYLLFVEPRLIGNLDVVSVRVADVCREVVGTPFGPKARLLV